MRHELHLTAAGLRATAIAGVALAVAGAWIAGAPGAASVLLATGVVAGNHLLQAASTAWARVFTPSVAAVGFMMFGVRMAAVLAALGWAASIPWMHRPLFAAAFICCLSVAIVTEWVSYSRKTYVPRWRLKTT